ncbi:MAG: ABC transporter ATP-binding protein [Deferrisomatales bacterium]
MRLLITFLRAYPGQSAVVLLALLLAGITEGIGLSALLPLLNLASLGPPGSEAPAKVSGAGRVVGEFLAVFGLRPTVGTLLVVIVAGIAVKSVLILLAKKRVGYAVAHVATDLRLRLLESLFASRWEYYLRQPVGSLANAVATEAMRASSAYLNATTLASLLIQAAVYSGVALMVSWKATGAALVAGLFTTLILRQLVRKARKAGARQTRLLKSLLAHLTDSLQSVKPLKAMARESFAGALLESETGKLDKALRKKVLSQEALRALQEPMFVSLVAVGLYVALVRWQMPLASVTVLAFLLTRVLIQLGKVQREYQKMATCDSAYWSLSQAIEEAVKEQEVSRGVLVPTLQEGIRFEGVSFAYDHLTVLAKVDLFVPAGKITTIVGPSGAGKTTIVDLVAGLLEPAEGRILIDGTPLPDLDLRRWRQMIGYVPQETLLLHDTIRHNVTLGQDSLTDADVERALRAAGAWEFVRQMPDGIHSPVGERGGKLSGGQRQRIAIARALVHRPRLLILDEATSALDATSAASICETLWRLRGELTVLAISHQPALVRSADRVYRLEAGKVELVAPGPAGEAPSRDPARPPRSA